MIRIIKALNVEAVEIGENPYKSEEDARGRVAVLKE